MGQSEKPVEPGRVQLIRVEAKDTSAAVYGMNREMLVRTAMWGKGQIREDARDELTRRLWNNLVKKAGR